LANAVVDSLDRRGIWSLTDRVLTAAFVGQTLDSALAGLGEETAPLGEGRGRGVPLIGHDPATIPRVFPRNGARLFPTGLFSGD
jgi:hypothetical protein